MEKSDKSDLIATSLSVTIVYKDLALGGVQKKLIDICRALSKKQHVSVKLILAQAIGEFLPLVPKQVKIVDLKIKTNLPSVLLLPLKLYFEFKKTKPDVIFSLMDTFGCASVIASFFLGNKKPKVIISQNTLETGFLRQRPCFWLRSFLVKTFYPLSRKVLTLSNAVTSDLINNFNVPRQKIKMIRNWVIAPKRSQIRKNPIKDIDVIYSGRLAEEKNLDLLLDSFWLLLKKLPMAKLYLLGYGKEETRLKAKVLDLKMSRNVMFRGFSSRIWNYLDRAKLFVITSKTEGTPLALLEAIAAGVPVISTGFKGIEEIIVNRASGIVADTKEEISHWMYTILTTPNLTSKYVLTAKRLLDARYGAGNLLRLVDFICSPG